MCPFNAKIRFAKNTNPSISVENAWSIFACVYVRASDEEECVF